LDTEEACLYVFPQYLHVANFGSFLANFWLILANFYILRMF
jgi:hypothetical protein